MYFSYFTCRKRFVKPIYLLFPIIFLANLVWIYFYPTNNREGNIITYKEFWWVLMGIGLAFLVWVIHKQNKRPDEVYLSFTWFNASFGFTTMFFTKMHFGNLESSSLVLDWTFTFASILPGAISLG
ncbi:hypothetical protein [Cecembia rubra]|uniref:Uncharacterized protein n=1 Tax=Cecembia rubra TaxID=1485585 RepID=A0A2P8E4H8_9BACT|nr:hypothetical protein [Cecembia rubra]PSL04376.1 hypothetical protein CLV48_105118 [Cecembia rubra]